MDPLTNALDRLERGDTTPCEWHVLWVITLGGDRHGLFTERVRLKDTVELGYATEELAEQQVRTHRYHRFFDAWLFNARTGDRTLVPARGNHAPKGQPHHPVP